MKELVRRHLEVVYDRLAIKEVICDGKEIPVESTVPSIVMFTLFVMAPRRRMRQGEESSNFAVYQGLADEHEAYYVRLTE